MSEQKIGTGLTEEMGNFTRAMNKLCESLNLASWHLTGLATLLSLPRFVKATDSLWFKIYRGQIR